MKHDERVAIYSRKSKFTGKGESIENQIELCRRYIAAQYGERIAEEAVVYEDEGFSGGNMERPMFKKMMADARREAISAIVVYRLDRISRNIGDFAKLIEELEELGISFVSIKEQFDTSSPLGRAMMYIASVFSQLERETIAERIRDNMQELAKTGRWLGGVCPTGYESEAVSKMTVEGKMKKVCKLKIIPEEARLVRLIFKKFLETNSLTKTDAYLLQNGYLSKNGIPFSRFTIKGILKNPTYMIADEDAFRYLSENKADVFSDKTEFDGKRGVIAYNRTIQKVGKANRERPMNEWIVALGAHEGLISGKQWVKVQKLLEQNSSKAYRKPKSNTALLSGILFCEKCGDYMRPKLTKRLNKQGEQVYTYLCQTKDRGGRQCCDGKNANGNQLDLAVLEEIKKLSEDKLEFIKQLEKSKKFITVSHSDYSDELNRLEQSRDENEKAIRALIAALEKADDGSAADYIIKEIEEKHRQNQGLSLRIEELKQKAKSMALTDEEFNLLSNSLAEFKNIFDYMGLEQRRSILRELIKKIVWGENGAEVYLFGSELEDADFPKPKSADSKKAEVRDLEWGVLSSGEGKKETLCEYSK
ncbi:MAG: recombinase family protein [Clostridiales bacterium]|nr:recombinase family protein [Clostridiales bacterium]